MRCKSASGVEEEESPRKQPPQVVGSLNAAEWRALSAPRWQCSVVQYGLRWPVREPPWWMSRRQFRPSTSAQQVIIDQEVRQLVSSGAIEPGPVRLTHPVFLVPKSSGQWRLVVDMRELNRFCDAPSFRFETFEKALRLVSPGDVLATFDLRSGYHHVPLHPALRPLMGMRINGTTYRWTVLPFGWNVAPYAFTRMVEPMVSWLRARGVRISPYLDDFLVVASSAAQMREWQTGLIEPVLARLGWQRAPAKGCWEPSSRVRFLGLEIDTAEFRVHVPSDKMARLRSLLTAAVAEPGRAWSARRMASLAGTLISVARAWPMVRAGLWTLFAQMRSAVLRKGWRSSATLSRESLEDLRFLLGLLPQLRGAPIRPTRLPISLWSDASDIGWGAVLPSRRLATAGHWSPAERLMHIQVREALAVERALRTFAEPVRGSRLELVVDNAALAAYLTHGGGSRARQLAAVVRRTMRLVVSLDAELTPARWVPSAENGEADFLSRHPDKLHALSGWRAVSPAQ